MANAGFLALPTGLQSAVQQNFLYKRFEDALLGRTAYSAVATKEPVGIREGQTQTFTRLAELAPMSAALSPPSLSAGLDDGIGTDTFSIEQYTVEPQYWARSMDVNIVQEQAMIARESLEVAGKQGRQAKWTREVEARNVLFNAYMGGNTRVINTSSNPSTTQCQVDDIRGLGIVMVNGVPTAVSGTNVLAVTEYPTATSGPQSQTLNVTGVTADGTNVSSCAATGGISGVITFQTASNAPAVGDTLVASNAPLVLRPNGKQATHLLTSQDLISMPLIQRGVAYLRDQGAPGFSQFGDDYVFISDNATIDQLFLDPAFMVAGTGRMDSVEFRGSTIKRYAGCSFMTSNFAFVQSSGSGVGVTVRRALIVAKDALLQCDFEGLEAWARAGGREGWLLHNIMMVDGIAHLIRPALDRAGQVVSFTWNGIYDYVAPSDSGTTPSIFPTASNSLYKRAVVLEFAG